MAALRKRFLAVLLLKAKGSGWSSGLGSTLDAGKRVGAILMYLELFRGKTLCVRKVSLACCWVIGEKREMGNI